MALKRNFISWYHFERLLFASWRQLKPWFPLYRPATIPWLWFQRRLYKYKLTKKMYLVWLRKVKNFIKHIYSFSKCESSISNRIRHQTRRRTAAKTNTAIKITTLQIRCSRRYFLIKILNVNCGTQDICNLYNINGGR